MMKKPIEHAVILLTLITSLLFASSCEKSGDIREADLIGTWDIGQASFDVKVGPISILQFLKTSLQFADQEAQDFVDQFISELDNISGGTITFNADKSYQLVKSDQEENGTWELEGDRLFLTITGEALDDNPIKVESLDGSTAHLKWEEDQEVDANEDGKKDFTATVIIELELSKQ